MTKNEKNHLIEIAERWANIPVPSHFDSFVEYQLHETTRRAINGLQEMTSKIALPYSTADKLHRKARSLSRTQIPGFALMAGIVKALPDRLEEIVLSMRIGLVSDEAAQAEDAIWGLFHWMKTSSAREGLCPKPPIDLVREIGVIIASRKSISLDFALQTARWTFDEGSIEQKDALRELVLQGLGYLTGELRYDRKHERDEDSIPSLRRRCVELAVSMANQGFEDAPAVSRWLKDAESDPMPEVRYAKVRQAAVFKRDRIGKMPGNDEGAGPETSGGDLQG